MDAKDQIDIPDYADAVSMNDYVRKEHETPEEKLELAIMVLAMTDLSQEPTRLANDTVLGRLEKLENLLTASTYFDSPRFKESAEMLDLDPNFMKKIESMLMSKAIVDRLESAWNEREKFRIGTGNFTRLDEVKSENADVFLASGKKMAALGQIFGNPELKEDECKPPQIFKRSMSC